MDYCQRIGDYIDSSNLWFPIQDASSYERIERIFIEFVEPFFKEHETIDAIIRSYEGGRYNPKLLFGIDIGWRTYNIGFCYKWLGQRDKALTFLKELVEQHSSDEFDWVQQRKKIAMEAIASMEQA